MSFMIETSARHIHLTQETVEKLFGEGYQLTVRSVFVFFPYGSLIPLPHAATSG